MPPCLWDTYGAGPGRGLVGIVVGLKASQANRLEATLEQRRVELGLPEIMLDMTSLVRCLPLPRQISSFRFPHRNADAYLRDTLMDGAGFQKTETGATVFDVTADKPRALLQWFSHALLFGF